ncbi:MAG TPA: TonB-dependent receptor, partial [Brevundimonas sp.]
MNYKSGLGLLTSLLLASTAMPAFAQTQTISAPETGPEEQATGLEDIVVTATKRETNLQDTPISISVVNAEALADRHIQSLMDLADGAVPSLRVATFEARQSALTIGIRGIVPNDANQPAREQGVGVYVDGVYLARQHGLGAALLDLERIEVLKGPQGTLFGRNTEGGALSMVTKKPTGEFGMRAVA